MSHITKVKTRITDLPAFEQACQMIGVILRREQKRFRNYGERQSKCDMAIVLPGNEKAYEAGLIKQADGSYEIALDNFCDGMGLNAKIGHDAGLLLQRYGLNVAKAKAQSQGMTVREQVLAPEPGQKFPKIRLICEPKPQFAQATAGAGGFSSGW